MSNDSNNKVSYIDPTNLKISTHTITCNIGEELNLHEVSRMIKIYNEDKDMEILNSKTGGFTKINYYVEKLYNDLPRGEDNIRLPAQVFNNQITLVYKYWGFKEINLKIFTNGELHMTGIKDIDFEPEHLANCLIDMIKSMKWEIWGTKDFITNRELVNNLDYVIYWNSEKSLCEYYRYNIARYNLCNILGIPDTYFKKHTVLKNVELKNDEGWTGWINNEEYLKWKEYNLGLTTKFLEYFNAIKDKMLLVNDFSVSTREKCYKDLMTFKLIIKSNKKYELFNNKKYKKETLKVLTKIIKWFKNYENIINNLHNTDIKIINDINKNNLKEIKKYFSKNENSNYLMKSRYCNRKNFKYQKFKIKLINCDFSTRFTNNIEMISNILKNKYRIYSSLNTDKKYPGIITKFRYNPRYLDSSKYEPGVCHCAVNCINKKKLERECIYITISIFRSGSIMITGSRSIEQIKFVYNFINKFMKDNFNEICEEASVDFQNNNSYEFNDDKKILRKKKLYYIKKSSIKYY